MYVQTLVIGGDDAEKGEYPWIAAIYNTSLGQKMYICGGTIISKLYIISGIDQYYFAATKSTPIVILCILAAHCFTNANGVPYDKSYYTIVAGKYHRDLDRLDSGMQKRNVRN